MTLHLSHLEWCPYPPGKLKGVCGLGSSTVLATMLVFLPSGCTKGPTYCYLQRAALVLRIDQNHCHCQHRAPPPQTETLAPADQTWVGTPNPQAWVVTSQTGDPQPFCLPGQWPEVVSLNIQIVFKHYLSPWVQWAWRLDPPPGMVWRCWGLSAAPICSPGPFLVMAAWPLLTPQVPLTAADGVTQSLYFVFEENHSHQFLPMGIPCHG